MKKFYMTAPYNTGLEKRHYEPADNQSLKMEGETSFPVFHLLYNRLEKGEEAELIVIATDYPAARDNIERRLSEEIDAFRKAGYILSLRIVEAAYDETADAQLKLFERLMDTVCDGDRLYACITFGTKPTAMVEMMFLKYAYHALKDVSVDGIVYGQIDHNDKSRSWIYDVSPIFYMEELVNTTVLAGVKNPAEAIRTALSL